MEKRQKYSTIRNQTLLFFVEKLIESEFENAKKMRTLHDLSCQFGSKGFTKEMRQIAGGSQSGLKKFLAEFPSLFEIHGDLVKYRNDEEDPVAIETEDEETQAVNYFKDKMLQYGISMWVPVKSLLGHRSQAPTHVRHISGQHLEDFKAFLGKHPSAFTVQNESVILTEFLNEQKKEVKKIDREKILKMLRFYGTILEERGPMLLEQLFHASCTLEEADFKTPNDLGVFLKMHKECFQLHNHLVTLAPTYKIGLSYYENKQQAPPISTQISITTIPPPAITKPTVLPPEVPTSKPAQPATLKNRVSQILLKTITQNNAESNHHPKLSMSMSLKSFDAIESPEDLKSYLVSKTTVVSSARKAKEIVDSLIKSGKPVAVDTEGMNIGDKETGQATLVQVCGEGSNGETCVWIFDVLTGGDGGIGGELRALLSNTEILKIFHDCRADSSILFHQLSILVQNVYDTQSAAQTLSSSQKSVSLNGLCSMYNILQNPFKDKVKSHYKHDPRYWARRPLTSQMIAYAACDVVCLYYLYKKMCAVVSPENELFKELVEEQILANINPDEIRARRKMRKNEKDLKELKAKIEDNLGKGEALVLSNRELRLLRHLQLSEDVKESLKSSLKIAKKLEKLEKKDESHSGESSLNSMEFNSGEEPTSNEFEMNFETIDQLLEGLSNVVGSEGRFKEIGVQTRSTGDVVVMSVYDESD